MKKDNMEVWDRIEAQLEALNQKMEILIKQSSSRPAPAPERHFEPKRNFERSYDSKKSFDSDRDFDDKKGRMQYKATCAECGKTCGVPFKPSGGRPVFCSECFERQQDSGGDEPRFHKKSKDFRKSGGGGGGKKPFFKNKKR